MNRGFISLLIILLIVMVAHDTKAQYTLHGEYSPLHAGRTYNFYEQGTFTCHYTVLRKTTFGKGSYRIEENQLVLLFNQVPTQVNVGEGEAASIILKDYLNVTIGKADYALLNKKGRAIEQGTVVADSLWENINQRHKKATHIRFTHPEYDTLTIDLEALSMQTTAHYWRWKGMQFEPPHQERYPIVAIEQPAAIAESIQLKNEQGKTLEWKRNPFNPFSHKDWKKED